MIREVLYFILILLLIVGIVMAITTIRITIAVGPSVEPTYHNGDPLMVEQYMGNPRKGDAVIVEHNGQL